MKMIIMTKISRSTVLPFSLITIHVGILLFNVGGVLA